jgi:hypothetical protein
MPEGNFSISTIANGAVKEKIDWELQKVMRNIADPNTDPVKARILTIKLKIEPDENREISDVLVSVESKPAPIKPTKTRLFIAEDGDGHFVASELYKDEAPGQVRIEDTKQEKTPDNVRELKKKKG